MTPKSLLRNERATSRIEDFTQSAFQQVLGPTLIGETKNVNRIIFCSGKVYYDLIGYFESNQVADTALIRSNNSIHWTGRPPNNHPRCEHAPKWVWCQEEPRNMGAWTYIRRCSTRVWPGNRVCRPTGCGKPGGWIKAWHDQQQKELVHHAFTV